MVKKHIDTVDEVLSSLKLIDKPFIQVFNKLDQISSQEQLDILKNKYSNSVFISAREDIEIESLIKKIERQIKSSYIRHIFTLTHSQSKYLDSIYKFTRVIDKKEDYNGIELKVEGSMDSIKKIKQIIEYEKK